MGDAPGGFVTADSVSPAHPVIRIAPVLTTPVIVVTTHVVNRLNA